MPASLKTNQARLSLTILATVLLAAAAARLHAGPDPARIKFPNTHLVELDRLYGGWHVVEIRFNARGEVQTTAKATEEVTWILDNHALRRTYIQKTDQELYEAVGTITWNDSAGEYRGVWFDNRSSSGPTTVSGQWMADSETFVFNLETIGEDGKPALYRVVERFIDDEQRAATMYHIKEDSVRKIMERQYKRAVPCPDRLRIIMDPGLSPG